MAKKSKNSINDNLDYREIAKLLESVIIDNGISPSNLMTAMSAFKNMSAEELYNSFYGYVKPDYSKKALPLHPALVPIVNKEGTEGLSALLHEALETLRKEDADTAGAALINAIYYILAHQTELMKGDHSNLPLFAILHMMIELEVKGATPAIIELLSQDGYFYVFFFDAFEEEMSFAISKLCKDDLKTLEEYMYATGRIPPTKCIVADGVIHMGITNPMMRIAVIAFFARVLKRYSEIVVYETNIDHIVNSLSQLKAKELIPLIENLYAIKDVPFIEIPNKKTLKKRITDGTDKLRVLTESIADTISTIEEQMAESDDFDEDEDWDEDDTLLVEGEEDGLLYRLEISLDDAPLEISRELIVPSNIRLSVLGKMLITVMGWGGGHLEQFIKGKEFYVAPYVAEDALETVDNDSSKYALNELLSRKGSKITWEYDFGDSWTHTIRLAEKIKDDGRCPIEVTKAVNACPPDDCGGVYGYSDMLKALKDKTHPEHDSWKEWVGPRFNPSKVSVKSINSKLKSYRNELK